MAINRDFIGREFRAGESFLVGREHIRQFATAIGDQNPLYHDVEAAKAAGYADLVAPPTFLTAASIGRRTINIADPELNLDYSLVVHGEERYTLVRPVVAGDELDVTGAITNIRDAGRNELMTAAYEFRTTAGELVAKAVTTLVSRGTAAVEEG